MKALKRHATSSTSFLLSVGLTLVAIYIVKLDNSQSFAGFATGAIVSVGAALIEERIESSSEALAEHLDLRLKSTLEVYRLLDSIDDESLRGEVVELGRALSAGEIPWFIAATRMQDRYRSARHSVYASNHSPSLDLLLAWKTTPRLRTIVAMSRDASQRGVKLARTFLLRRAEIVDSSGGWLPGALDVLIWQRDAGISVFIIWLEDLERDNLPPRLSLIRNFTIFDEMEALETTSVQVMFRRPHPKIQELMRMREEQYKYSLALKDAIAP